MNILSFFARKDPSAAVAKSRLKILLAHERGSDGNDAALISSLREDILAVVKKHIDIDIDAVRLEMDRNGDTTTLGIDIELPGRARSA